MSKHLGKRERRAGKRHKRRNLSVGWSNANGSGSLTLKLGKRKREKIASALLRLTGFPF